MAPAGFSVRASPDQLLLLAWFVPVIAGAAVWIAVTDVRLAGVPGRVFGSVPFGRQLLVAAMIVVCGSLARWLVRIRPPRPFLWLDGRTIVVEGFGWRRRCDLSNVSSMYASSHLISMWSPKRRWTLEIVRVRGRKLRVGLQPANESWEDVLKRLVAAIEALPVVVP
jgi:hypothetical protein